MLEQKSLDKIDGDYFNIIIADSQDVTIQSRNTGHYWYLHCAGYPTEEALVIFTSVGTFILIAVLTALSTFHQKAVIFGLEARQESTSG